MKEKRFTWKDDAKITDYTESVKKIWDEVIPKTMPNIIKFETHGAVYVFEIERMGPYHMNRRSLKFNVDVNMNPKPFLDFKEQTGIESPTYEDFLKIYGQEFPDELRKKMINLLKYVGLKISQFDFDGDLTYHIEN